jgi:hypothetical protein
MFEAILKSVGVEISDDFVQSSLITLFESKDMKKSDGTPETVLYMRYVPPTPFQVNPEDD